MRQQGLEHLTHLLACFPRRIERAQELEDAGEYMQAMELWRAAYKICPQLEEPSWNSNGMHLQCKGMHEDAILGAYICRHAVHSRRSLLRADGGKTWSQM